MSKIKKIKVSDTTYNLADTGAVRFDEAQSLENEERGQARYNIEAQKTLVSGTNIKTINSTSVLGSGDISVQPVLTAGTGISIVNNVISVSGLVQTVCSTITGDGSTSTFTITHSLNTRDIIVQVYDLTNYENVIVDIARPTVNTITVGFKDAPTSSESYRVLIQSFGSAISAENVDSEEF